MAQGWSQVWADLLASLRFGQASGNAGAERTDDDDRQTDAATAAAEDDGSPPDQPPLAAAKAPDSEKHDAKILPVLAFTAVVCVILISIAAWILIPYFVPPAKPALSDVVATFDGGEITVADMEEHLKVLPPARQNEVKRSSAQLLLMVEEMISDKLVLEWASQRKPETDATFQHAVQHADEKLGLDTLSKQIQEKDIVVTESEIRGYYDGNRATFDGRDYMSVRDEIRRTLAEKKAPEYIEAYLQRLRSNSSVERNFELLDVPPPSQDEIDAVYRGDTARYALPKRAVVDQIEVPISVFGDASQSKANDVLLRIRGGASFQEVAERDDDLRLEAAREIAEGQSKPGWDANVFALMPGDMASVFRAGESYYVVRLVELRPARQQALEEVRQGVVAEANRRRQEQWFADNGAKVLFTLKGQRYTLAQFYTEYGELPEAGRTKYAGAAGMRTLADSIIDRMLLVSETYDKLVDVTNKSMSDEARIGLLKMMREKEEVDDKVDVSEAEIEAFYARNRMQILSAAKARIRYMRIGLGGSEDEAARARVRAQEAYSKLAGSAGTFADIARDYSEATEAGANGGMFEGWIGENNNPFADIADHPLHEAAMKLDPGKPNAPIEIAGSIYIIEMLEKTEAKRISFKDARPMIREALLKSRHRELANQLTRAQLQEYNVKTIPTVLSAYATSNANAAAVE